MGRSFMNKSTASIQLCVANAIEPQQQPNNGWTTPYSEWCAENNFEFVVADKPSLFATNKGTKTTTMKPLLSSSNNNDDDDDDDNYGVEGADRILEALESNMWENMVRKGTGVKNLGQMSQPEALQETLSKIDSTDNDNNTEADTNEKASINQFSQAAQAVEMLFQQFCPAQTTTTNNIEKKKTLDDDDDYLSQLIHAGLKGDNKDLDADGDDDDEDFQALETMFLRMREMRNRASSLSDEQRKEMAAKVALTFSQLLGDD
eukprot:TRINITY_DN8779_c0_g1_i1.p1 TRINITY_DN8779_c0_g1~~TRINITY_DN8779_c0_g1_i1.p1  ORF type:complete len:261 (-),score=93.18 TRINITY_DN8779_c0_g1_i1:40-822(-)